MTDDRMALLELIEKGADSDLIRELLAFASQRLMAAEVDQLTGAPAGIRSADRNNHRNGYRERPVGAPTPTGGRPASAGSSSPSRSSGRAPTLHFSHGGVDDESLAEVVKPAALHGLGDCS